MSLRTHEQYGRGGVRRLIGRTLIVLALTGEVLVGWAVAASGLSESGGAGAPPPTTFSRYEQTTDPARLFAQGESDARAGVSGATILDFGRPAADVNGAPAMLDFGGGMLMS